ncbi:hypothetical protein Pelo_1716 [Pelomyxa schiedti]|nr:hypothetical protein Pelo_1716 [Pelomyxa schiedti]
MLYCSADNLPTVFRVYDRDNDGKVTEEEGVCIIQSLARNHPCIDTQVAANLLTKHSGHRSRGKFSLALVMRAYESLDKYLSKLYMRPDVNYTPPDEQRSLSSVESYSLSNTFDQFSHADSTIPKSDETELAKSLFQHTPTNSQSVISLFTRTLWVDKNGSIPFVAILYAFCLASSGRSRSPVNPPSPIPFYENTTLSPQPPQPQQLQSTEEETSLLESNEAVLQAMWFQFLPDPLPDEIISGIKKKFLDITGKNQIPRKSFPEAVAKVIPRLDTNLQSKLSTLSKMLGYGYLDFIGFMFCFAALTHGSLNKLIPFTTEAEITCTLQCIATSRLCFDAQQFNFIKDVFISLDSDGDGILSPVQTSLAIQRISSYCCLNVKDVENAFVLSGCDLAKELSFIHFVSSCSHFTKRATLQQISREPVLAGQDFEDEEQLFQQQEEAESWAKTEREKHVHRVRQLVTNQPSSPNLDIAPPSPSLSPTSTSPKLASPCSTPHILTPRTHSCAKCGGLVTVLDKIQALGRAWHRTCFTCTTCGEKLDLETLGTPRNLVETDQLKLEPLCKECYSQGGSIRLKLGVGVEANLCYTQTPLDSNVSPEGTALRQAPVATIPTNGFSPPGLEISTGKPVLDSPSKSLPGEGPPAQQLEELPISPPASPDSELEAREHHLEEWVETAINFSSEPCFWGNEEEETNEEHPDIEPTVQMGTALYEDPIQVKVPLPGERLNESKIIQQQREVERCKRQCHTIETKPCIEESSSPKMSLVQYQIECRMDKMRSNHNKQAQYQEDIRLLISKKRRARNFLLTRPPLYDRKVQVCSECKLLLLHMGRSMSSARTCHTSVCAICTFPDASDILNLTSQTPNNHTTGESESSPPPTCISSAASSATQSGVLYTSWTSAPTPPPTVTITITITAYTFTRVLRPQHNPNINQVTPAKEDIEPNTAASHNVYAGTPPPHTASPTPPPTNLLPFVNNFQIVRKMPDPKRRDTYSKLRTFSFSITRKVGFVI